MLVIKGRRRAHARTGRRAAPGSRQGAHPARHRCGRQGRDRLTRRFHRQCLSMNAAFVRGLQTTISEPIRGRRPQKLIGFDGVRACGQQSQSCCRQSSEAKPQGCVIWPARPLSCPADPLPFRGFRAAGRRSQVEYLQVRPATYPRTCVRRNRVRRPRAPARAAMRRRGQYRQEHPSNLTANAVGIRGGNTQPPRRNTETDDAVDCLRTASAGL